MLLNKINNLQEKINILINLNYWNRNLGIARTLLAISLLLTLLFNTYETLFYFGFENQIPPKFNKFNFISIYNLFDNLNYAKYLSILILVFVISGVYPKVTCIFHWWVSFSFVTTCYSIDGGDQINSILTFLLIPICLTDKRKNHWVENKFNFNPNYLKNIIAFFCFILIQIQVSIIYFNSSVGKFVVSEWKNGTALYYWLTNQSFGMNEYMLPFLLPVLKSPFFVVILTWGVLIFELLLFSCLFIKNQKIKKIFWLLGVCFHLFIVIFHGLVSFFFTMASALTLYLITKKQSS